MIFMSLRRTRDSFMKLVKRIASGFDRRLRCEFNVELLDGNRIAINECKVSKRGSSENHSRIIEIDRIDAVGYLTYEVDPWWYDYFDVEVDVAGLKKMSVESAEMRNNIMGYRLENGSWIYVLAEGRLVNLAAGDGHPAEIMDMSFAIQALSARYLVENSDKISTKLIKVPEEVDHEVAMRKLEYMGKKIDMLTAEQKKYLNLD